MRMEDSSTLNPPSVEPGQRQPEPEDSSQESAISQQAVPQEDNTTGTTSATLLGKHKGKLAVGAAAMLGIAIFYKWRESKLAKEDPEEYARLQRLKAAIGIDASAPEQALDPELDQTKVLQNEQTIKD